MKRRTIQRGQGKQIVDGANFRLIDEVHYIQDRAAEQVSRVITLPQWLLFSTQTGDAWLLDPADHLAVPLARMEMTRHRLDELFRTPAAVTNV